MDHIKEFAPRSQHHDAPSKFGVFLEDVLGVLGVFGRNGQSVSAAVALRSYSAIRKQLGVQKT